MRKAWLRVVLFALLLCFRPAAKASGAVLALEADSLEIGGRGEYIQAEGNVVLTYEDLTLRADGVVCRGRMVEAGGSVTLRSSTAALQAARLSVDLDSGVIAGEGLKGLLNGCFIEAAALGPIPSGGKSLEETSFTRCDLPAPCYQFRAARILMEGRRVTILRAWLLLRGLRLVPLPRITLDLDRLEEWPQLNMGYDERGFYLEAAFTTPLPPRWNLVWHGEYGTLSGFFLKLAAPWHPGGKMSLEPWVAWVSSTGAAGYGLAVTGPSYDLAGGKAALEGHCTWDPGGSEAGGALLWSRPLTAEGNDVLGLKMGWYSASTGNRPVFSVQFASSRQISARWHLALSCAYDLAAGTWEEAPELAAIHYFHCYSARLGLDLLRGGLSFTGGIRF